MANAEAGRIEQISRQTLPLLQEIGDHLGHCDPEATRIYAKVDLVRLREVANFDLGELL